MTYNINIKNNPALLCWVIISAAVLIGIYIRIKGIGTWPLALDEYYIIKSSENILKYGLPQFPNGGYYTRGILMQYLIAPLLTLGVKAEVAGRIFPLISNLIAIPALYLISKRVGNRLVATIAVVIFSLSIWEIEFARFARMYAPFQAIFLWYMYFALKDFENKNFSNYRWLLILSTISIFIYEGSLFLAVFNFVPFVVIKKIKPKFLVWAILIFIFSAFMNTFDFRTICSNPIFPPEYLSLNQMGNNLPPVKLPPILLQFAFQNVISTVFSSVLLAVNFILTLRCIKSIENKNFWSISSILVLSILALFNQFGLMILLFLILIFWNFLDVHFSDKKTISNLLLILIINLIFWYVFGLLTKNWQVLFSDFSSLSVWGITKKLLVGFFNYPDNYFTFINYFSTIPIITISSVVALISLFLFFSTQKEKSGQIKFLFGAVIFLGLIATFPTLLYQETRYTFFLAPLVLALVLVSVNELTNLMNKKKIFSNIGFVLIVMAVFISSNDFNLYHLLNIDKQEVNYRMIYKDNHFRVHLYRRWDVLTPMQFVKNNLKKGDLIMINENSHEYYLPRVDYFNFDYKHHAFATLAVEGGRKERWSNAKLIYTEKDLINLIENRKTTIWFTVYPEFWLYDIGFYERYKENLVCKGVDGMIKVYKFPPKNESSKVIVDKQ